MADDLQCPISPSSSKTSSKDSTFEPTVDMMVNDFDDERTLEEEETIAAQEQEDSSVELSNLQRESDMPIEELLALYRIPVESIKIVSGKDSGVTKRNTKKRKDNFEYVDKFIVLNEIMDCKNEHKKLMNNEAIVEKMQKHDKSNKGKINIKPSTSSVYNQIEISDTNFSEEEDNLIDIDEVDTDYEEENPNFKEESHLKKLYPETYKAEDKRLLRTLSRQQSEEEEEDGDYSPDEDEVRKCYQNNENIFKTIMIGNEYQAVIPEGFSKYDDVLPYENEDKLLWDPSRITDANIIEFLIKAQEQTKSSNNSSSLTDNITQHISGSLRDDEQALFLLLQCGYNVEEALRRKRINPLPATDQMSIWSEEECRNFESVIRLYGKDFHTIKHAKVHTRSVGELVQFYYLWKKTERHDVFANKARLDKKKSSIHPGITDYMDKFLEELDTANNQNCNSNSNSLLFPVENSLSPSPSVCNINTVNNIAAETIFPVRLSKDSNTYINLSEVISAENNK